MATICGTTASALNRAPPAIDLQGQRAAGENRGQPDNRQGQPADVQQRDGQFAEIEGRAQQVAERLHRIKRHAPDSGQQAKDRGPDGGEKPHSVYRRA